MRRRRPSTYALTRRILNRFSPAQIAWGSAFILLFLFFYQFSIYLTSTRMPDEDKPAIFYANQLRDDLRLTMIHAISSAKEDILLFTYALQDPSIIFSLRSKSEKGVNVEVISDYNASGPIDCKLGDKVKTTLVQGKGLMHRKILVIDKEKVWIGSANMTTSSLRTHGNLVVGFQSRKVAQLIKENAKNHFENVLPPSISHCHFSLPKQKGELLFFPEDERGPDKLIDLIQTAKKTVKVAMFTWTRTDLATALIQAQKRGLQVEVAIDRTTGKGASKRIVRLLQRHRIPVFFNRSRGLLHYKFLLIDDETLINGSANWTKAAFTQNDDCYMILEDLTLEQKKTMEKLWRVIKRDGRLTNLSANSNLLSLPSFWLLFPLPSYQTFQSWAAKQAKRIAQNEKKSDQIAIYG